VIDNLHTGTILDNAPPIPSNNPRRASVAQGPVADPIAEVLEQDAVRVLRLSSPRRVEALNMSLARDVGGWLLGQIPLVGDFLADAYEDNLWADMRRRLTAQEVNTFTEVTRRYPDTLALLATFQQVRE
jgi:hypothetical protein